MRCHSVGFGTASNRDLLCQTRRRHIQSRHLDFTGLVHYAAHDRNPYAFQVCDVLPEKWAG
jgi:hypothetical protein